MVAALTSGCKMCGRCLRRAVKIVWTLYVICMPTSMTMRCLCLLLVAMCFSSPRVPQCSISPSASIRVWAANALVQRSMARTRKSIISCAVATRWRLSRPQRRCHASIGLILSRPARPVTRLSRLSTRLNRRRRIWGANLCNVVSKTAR